MSVRPMAAVAVFAVLSLLSVGCGGADETATGDDETVAPPTDRETSSPSPALEDVIAEARGLVADDAGVPAADVELIEAGEVTWRDGALGCPRPDQVYTQALVEGYRIVMEAGGQEFHVHGASGQPPFICQDPQEPSHS